MHQFDGEIAMLTTLGADQLAIFDPVVPLRDAMGKAQVALVVYPPDAPEGCRRLFPQFVGRMHID